MNRNLGNLFHVCEDGTVEIGEVPDDLPIYIVRKLESDEEVDLEHDDVIMTRDGKSITVKYTEDSEHHPNNVNKRRSGRRRPKRRSDREIDCVPNNNLTTCTVEEAGSEQNLVVTFGEDAKKKSKKKKKKRSNKTKSQGSNNGGDEISEDCPPRKYVVKLDNNEPLPLPPSFLHSGPSRSSNGVVRNTEDDLSKEREMIEQLQKTLQELQVKDEAEASASTKKREDLVKKLTTKLEDVSEQLEKLSKGELELTSESLFDTSTEKGKWLAMCLKPVKNSEKNKMFQKRQIQIQLADLQKMSQELLKP